MTANTDISEAYKEVETGTRYSTTVRISVLPSQSPPADIFAFASASRVYNFISLFYGTRTSLTSLHVTDGLSDFLCSCVHSGHTLMARRPRSMAPRSQNKGSHPCCVSPSLGRL